MGTGWTVNQHEALSTFAAGLIVGVFVGAWLQRKVHKWRKK